jgi:hypothetical protein
VSRSPLEGVIASDANDTTTGYITLQAFFFIFLKKNFGADSICRAKFFTSICRANHIRYGILIYA